MKHLFRFAALTGAAILTLSVLTACGTSPAKTDGLRIVTTTYAVYDMAKQLTAQYTQPAAVTLLLTPGGESHSYEPSPADVAAIQSCELFVYIGGESEVWADKLISASRAEKENLRMFDCVELLDEETVEGMEADEEDEEEDVPDEHIWTSPLNADAMLSALHDTLNRIAPEEAANCDAAFAPLHEDFLALDQKAKEIKANQRTNTLVFADRFPFRYLTDAYGWDYYAAFSGCSSDTDASAATLSFLISKVQEQNIGTVFYLENSSQKISDAVCRATGAKAVMMQSGNNVSAEDFKAGRHYQDIMAENLAAIQEALS